jgi:tetratricopeptide (TPR) repeat protein
MSGPQRHDPIPGEQDREAATDPMQILGCPRARGQQLLAAARESGDRRAEAAALTDLAVMAMNDGDHRRALDQLKEALDITRALGDRVAEADVVANFGLLSLRGSDPRLSRHLFEQELGFAREYGDRFAEKTALEHLGMAHARLGDPTRALDFFEQALALARAAGDRQHEVTLLWQQGIQHAERGERDQAVAKARLAVDLCRNLDSNQADLLADHLQRYCHDDPAALAGPVREAPPAIPPGGFLGGSIIVSSAPAAGSPVQATGGNGRGPGLLRMGLSAARSMTRFVRSGFKTAEGEVLEQRVRACAACEHHTGLRCKVCGCFTNVKTRLAHEVCPAGKWPG